MSYPSWRLLSWLTGHHAAAGNRLEQLLNLRSAVDELVRPELEGGVLDELNEGDEQAPGMRSVHNQPLQQNPADGNVDFPKTQSLAK